MEMMASQMDTTKKGDSLEDKVYALFAEQISEDRFFAKSEYCRMHQKKGYFSKDREKEIIFDVSIEISFPDQTSYSILILIECKNYSHSVPVDDVEEFFSKTQQISGCNTKGIVVSTNSFQEGTFNFSRSKGIALLRYYDRDNLDWVLTRSPSGMALSNSAIADRSNAHQGLHSQDHISRYFDCYCFIDEIYTNSLNQFVSRLVKSDLDCKTAEFLVTIERGLQASSHLVPYKENHEIDLLCRAVLQDVGYDGGIVPLNILCESLSTKHGLMVQYNSSLPAGV
jgi:hypothetical protein